ncbi:MAG TPA: prenyltransferase [Candidatus Nitrosotalea sp.]|nr:prenyltransferase [Candidatus Nitrosotalea sp.]
MLSAWLRAVRIRFLLASVIATFLGLSISWWKSSTIDIGFALLTVFGVVALHASVDLLNDYWDFKRKIDLETKRTKFSGGTGVLPEGLLSPSQVYRAGMILLIAGAIIGAFFIYERGITIAIILGFAIISIYFYSTRIVDSGLGEVFVAIKGAMIVLGTYFVQTSQLGTEPVLGGIVAGVLSSTVLFVNSFPDYEADKSHGRRTLVILLGRRRAALTAWVFPAVSNAIVVGSSILHIFPFVSLTALVTLPIAIKSCIALRKNFESEEGMIPIMKNFVSYSRLTGIILVASFVADHIIRMTH